MQLEMMGLNYQHKRGEFCGKKVFKHYTISCFATPFTYLRENTMCEGEKWQILINSPGSTVYHGPKKNSETGFINDWFYVFGADLTNLLSEYPLPLNCAFSVGERLFLRKFGIRLLNEFSLCNRGASDIIHCILTEMIIQLHRAYNKEITGDSEYDSIRRIRQKILLEPRKKWSLEEMSKASGYSVSRFCELYSKTFGVSPISDVIGIRIELAKKLLCSGQATVSEVADSCGFSTINYFSAYFKKATGQSPAKYAKQSIFTP